MKIEKLDRVAIYVKNLDDAVSFFSDLFETSFRVGQPTKQDISGDYVRAAIAPFGLELVERLKPPAEIAGLTSFHLKVPDIEAARKEMKGRGYDPIAEIREKKLKELIYIIRGIRIIFVEYQGNKYGLE